MKIYILHENKDWTDPLLRELEKLDLPYEDWFLDEGCLDTSIAPPQGVFYNRMSPSSHTRGHRYAPEYTSLILNWLESYDRCVLNSAHSLTLEVSKIAQYAALKRVGVKTPRTLAAVGKKNIVDAAKKIDAPFITKHNRAGKGLGVRLFQSVAALENYVASDAFEEPLDGVTLIQQYIRAPDASITRCELIGREFLYAVRVDTSEGFELCPADACQIGDAACPVGEISRPKFEVIPNYSSPLLERYKALMVEHSIHVAAFENIQDQAGDVFTYDINMNTNYNPAAESVAGLYGMKTLAAYLGRELARVRTLTVR